MSEKEKEKKNEPVHKIRMGNVSADIWANQTEKGKMLSIGILKSYKDDKDEWQTSSSYSRNDLPKVQAVSMLAYEWCFGEEAKKHLE